MSTRSIHINGITNGESELSIDSSILISGSFEYYESIGINLIATLRKLATEMDCGEIAQDDWNVIADYLIEHGADEPDVICKNGALIAGDVWLRYLAGGKAKSPIIKKYQWIFSTISVTQKWPSKEVPEDVFMVLERISNYCIDFSGSSSCDKMAELYAEEFRNKSCLIWNPNAAATWSIVFTPVFGCVLHSLNWQSLKEFERGNNTYSWMWIWVGVLTLYVIIAKKANGDDEILAAMQLVYLIFFISWYFIDAKAQISYIRSRYGSYYKKRSWFIPILAGATATVILFMVI